MKSNPEGIAQAEAIYRQEKASKETHKAYNDLMETLMVDGIKSFNANNIKNKSRMVSRSKVYAGKASKLAVASIQSELAKLNITIPLLDRLDGTFELFIAQAMSGDFDLSLDTLTSALEKELFDGMYTGLTEYLGMTPGTSRDIINIIQRVRRAFRPGTGKPADYLQKWMMGNAREMFYRGIGALESELMASLGVKLPHAVARALTDVLVSYINSQLDSSPRQLATTYNFSKGALKEVPNVRLSDFSGVETRESFKNDMKDLFGAIADRSDNVIPRQYVYKPEDREFVKETFKETIKKEIDTTFEKSNVAVAPPTFTASLIVNEINGIARDSAVLAVERIFSDILRDIGVNDTKISGSVDRLINLKRNLEARVEFMTFGGKQDDITNNEKAIIASLNTNDLSNENVMKIIDKIDELLNSRDLNA